MAQKIYAVALDSPEPAVEDRLKERFPKVLKHTDTLLLVVGEANDIKETVTTVNARMESVATKHLVVWCVIGIVIFNFFTLVGHLLIRSLGSG